MAAWGMQRHRENRYRSVKRTRELRTSAAYETPHHPQRSSEVRGAAYQTPHPALPTREIPRP